MVYNTENTFSKSQLLPIYLLSLKNSPYLQPHKKLFFISIICQLPKDELYRKMSSNNLQLPTLYKSRKCKLLAELQIARPTNKPIHCSYMLR